MSNGHSFKHVERGEFNEQRRQGSDTGVRSRQDFAEHIAATMTAADTICFVTQHKHEIYYRSATNTLVAYDPSRKDLGTCFRPTSGIRKFEQEFEKDVRHGGSRDRSRILTGGYEALRKSEREQVKTREQRLQENAKRLAEQYRQESRERDGPEIER